MISNMIITESLPAPEIDRAEVLRYASVRGASPEADSLLNECIDEAKGQLVYKVCYRVLDISHLNEGIDLGFAVVNAPSVVKRLEECNKIMLFCATVGVGIDRLIAKYSLFSPARAVMMQALGSERVEAVCDSLCSRIDNEVRSLGGSTTVRFSPGYGDIPLDLQRKIFDSLECTRRIGVSLGSNLFMTPTKSVTAIIGIKM